MVFNVAIEVSTLHFAWNHRYLSSFMAGVTYDYSTTDVIMLQLRRIEGASNCEDVLSALPTLAGGTKAKIAASLGRRVIIYGSLVIFTIKNKNKYPQSFDL